MARVRAAARASCRTLDEGSSDEGGDDEDGDGGDGDEHRVRDLHVKPRAAFTFTLHWKFTVNVKFTCKDMVKIL